MAFAMRARDNLSMFEKIAGIRWSFLLLLTCVASVGFMSLYSAAGGSWEPWAGKQAMRFAVGMCGLIVVSMIDIRFWMKMAYPIYGCVVLALVYVDISGHIGMGAQRWINLGFIQLQPSEFMKIASVLALARFFHGATVDEVRKPLFLLIPLAIIALPISLKMLGEPMGEFLASLAKAPWRAMRAARA
jgi:rod shape determining protein RodA